MVLYLIAVIVPVSSVFIKKYLDVDGLRKQIPVTKVVVYLGVITLTFMDKIFATVNSDLALKSAVLMAAVYEVLSIIVEHNMIQIKKEHMKTMKKVKWEKDYDFMDDTPRYTFEGRDPANTYAPIRVVIYTERE